MAAVCSSSPFLGPWRAKQWPWHLRERPSGQGGGTTTAMEELSHCILTLCRGLNTYRATLVLPTPTLGLGSPPFFR